MVALMKTALIEGNQTIHFQNVDEYDAKIDEIMCHSLKAEYPPNLSSRDRKGKTEIYICVCIYVCIYVYMCIYYICVYLKSPVINISSFK